MVEAVARASLAPIRIQRTNPDSDLSNLVCQECNQEIRVAKLVLLDWGKSKGGAPFLQMVFDYYCTTCKTDGQHTISTNLPDVFVGSHVKA